MTDTLTTCPVTGKDLSGMGWVQKATHLYFYAHMERAIAHHAGAVADDVMFLAMDAWTEAARLATEHYRPATRSTSELIMSGVMTAQASWGFFPAAAAP